MSTFRAYHNTLSGLSLMAPDQAIFVADRSLSEVVAFPVPYLAWPLSASTNPWQSVPAKLACVRYSPRGSLDQIAPYPGPPLLANLQTFSR